MDIRDSRRPTGRLPRPQVVSSRPAESSSGGEVAATVTPAALKRFYDLLRELRAKAQSR